MKQISSLSKKKKKKTFDSQEKSIIINNTLYELYGDGPDG